MSNLTIQKHISASGIAPLAYVQLIKAITGVTALQAKWYKGHAYTITSQRFLGQPYALPLMQADKRWDSRSEPFWWSCVTPKEADTMKRTMRSWLARRTRNAMIEALKKAGIAGDGMKLDGTGLGLYGTLQLLPVTSVAMTMPYAKLVKEAELLVEHLVAKQDLSIRTRQMAKKSRHHTIQPLHYQRLEKINNTNPLFSSQETERLEKQTYQGAPIIRKVGTNKDRNPLLSYQGRERTNDFSPPRKHQTPERIFYFGNQNRST